MRNWCYLNLNSFDDRTVCLYVYCSVLLSRVCSLSFRAFVGGASLHDEFEYHTCDVPQKFQKLLVSRRTYLDIKISIRWISNSSSDRARLLRLTPVRESLQSLVVLCPSKILGGDVWSVESFCFSGRCSLLSWASSCSLRSDSWFFWAFDSAIWTYPTSSTANWTY